MHSTNGNSQDAKGRQEDPFSLERLRQRWSRGSRQEEGAQPAPDPLSFRGQAGRIGQDESPRGLFARLRTMLASQPPGKDGTLIAGKMEEIGQILDEMETEPALAATLGESLRQQLINLEDLLEAQMLEKR